MSNNMSERCMNCRFAEKIKGDVEWWKLRDEEYAKKAEQVLEADSSPSFFLPRHTNWTLYHQYRKMSTEAYIEAVRIDSMLMCHRFPETRDVSKEHWCGEFRRVSRD